MKSRIFGALSMLLLLGSGLFAQQGRNCGTMDNQARLDRLDPGFAATRARIEGHTQSFVDQYQGGNQDVVYNIPVVVHVLYNTSAQNVSDAQIQSQIAVLNADYRKLNSDASLVPSAFAGLAADCEINFCLATTDPNGAATTGITRTATSTTAFGTNDAMKFNSSGGKDAWPRGSYLNIWVCNVSGGILGYAQFPGGAAATDGVVINYTAFGTTGSAAAPFNKGRTGTHEVGHWLNLNHIWGDDGTACTGTDNVADTPNQADENYGCPSFPQVSCSNGPNGDMFMNYMDYTDDACMFMFTAGQKARMVAVLAPGGARASLASSTGCSGGGGGTPSYCASNGQSTADEWIASVAIGSFSNVSGNNGGYGNFTGTNINLTKGSAYSLTLTPGFTGTAYNEYWKIWIDYNGDSDFADAGELVYDAGSASSAVRTGSFTVPTAATATTTRMRISMKYNAASTECESFAYGEVEDYGVTLSASAPSCGNPTGLSAGSVTSSGATLSWAAVSGAVSYNVQYKLSTSSTWTTTTSTTTSRALTGLAASSTYNWQVQAVCSGASGTYVVGSNFTTLASGGTCTDSYEANETSGAAKVIGVNTNISARICTATDVDWYRFTTTSGAAKVKINLTTLPADYDVYLYNSSLTLLGSGTNGGTTSEQIIYNTTTARTYYVRVIGYGGVNSSTPYTLRASTQNANWRESGILEPIVAKDLSEITQDEMTVYPNPVAQNLFVNYSTLTEGEGTLMLMDLSGRIVIRRELSLSPGANVIDFSVADLAEGMYIVRLQTATGLHNAKVQVMH